MAYTGESERLLGMKARRELVTLVTNVARKLQRIASYTRKER